MKVRVDMGADRLKEKKDEAKRGWNRAGLRLMQPLQLSLFDAAPEFDRRSFRIMLRNGATACVGEQLLLQNANDAQMIIRGPEVVGECTNLPAAILDDLKIGGVICLEVVGVGAIGNTLEVSPK